MDHANDLIGTLREGFAGLLEQRPLAVGILGLAAGAGLAAVLPRIAAEDALTGPASSFARHVRDEVSEAYERGVAEAKAQGLTPEAATEALSDVRSKVSDVAKTAMPGSPS